MTRITNLVFLCVIVLSQVCSEVPGKVLLTVYYESQCPDSKEFIIKQLQPTVNLLHEYLLVKLIPFGKAKSINNGYNGFECQHGPSECAGNLVQGCALDLMPQRSDLEKVSYVACEMQTEAAIRGDMQCIAKAGIPIETLNYCVHYGRGVSIQLENEYLTSLVRPSFIPTITIDWVFNQQVQDSAFKDLKGTLCSILKNTPPCAQHYNNMALSYVLF